MHYRLISLTGFLLVILFVVSQQTGSRVFIIPSKYLEADRLYNKAGELSNSPDYNDETEKQEIALNKKALNLYEEVLPAVQRSGYDSLLYYLYLKSGTIRHYFDELQQAADYYKKAIELRPSLHQFPDSLFFETYMYCGSVHYAMNKWDTAIQFYRKAEELTNKYKDPLPGSNRLYNMLGAVYYENGNFSQAKNYFGKALQLFPGPPNHPLAINYKMNLASVLSKLEDYNAADSIFRSLLPYEVNTNEILHNTGVIHLKLGAPKKALDYFRQVGYSNASLIRLYHDIASAHLMMKNHDSSIYYTNRALAENEKINRHSENVATGNVLKTAGDAYAAMNKNEEALRFYQLAIHHFNPLFSSQKTSDNPEKFEAVFAYIPLFNTLIAKADLLQNIYGSSKELASLQYSLHAYQSAYKLAAHVESVYDSDEARLFLNRIKHTVHNRPIDLSLSLYEITKEDSFLHAAYYFDQQNKASVLTIGIKEGIARNSDPALAALLQEENYLRSQITRTSLKAMQSGDSAMLSAFRNEQAEYEIRLGRTRDKLRTLQRAGTQEIPSIKKIQSELDRKTTLLSFHIADSNIIVFISNKNKFSYKKIRYGGIEKELMNRYIVNARNISSQKNVEDDSKQLYKLLVNPVGTELSKSSRLVIIPDDELNYLPFESLINDKNEYLGISQIISYQYNTALLFGEKNRGYRKSIAAFAPFASVSDSSGKLSSLPASKDEVSGIKGEIYKNEKAGKQAFMLIAESKGILHLATHAIVDNDEPEKSFIAFYPGEKDNKLFANEIPLLNLDSTGLVILSACETGTGQLIRGEGLMSLSRSFAYAGCPNIIASLWKAEDKATAYIINRLHHYLDKGYRKDESLSKARIDFLKDKSVHPRFKHPSHWAHLVFIGEYEKSDRSDNWLLFLIAGIALVMVLVYVARKRL